LCRGLERQQKSFESLLNQSGSEGQGAMEEGQVDADVGLLVRLPFEIGIRRLGLRDPVWYI